MSVSANIESAAGGPPGCDQKWLPYASEGLTDRIGRHLWFARKKRRSLYELARRFVWWVEGQTYPPDNCYATHTHSYHYPWGVLEWIPKDTKVPLYYRVTPHMWFLTSVAPLYSSLVPEHAFVIFSIEIFISETVLYDHPIWMLHFWDAITPCQFLLIFFRLLFSYPSPAWLAESPTKYLFSLSSNMLSVVTCNLLTRGCIS